MVQWAVNDELKYWEGNSRDIFEELPRNSQQETEENR